MKGLFALALMAASLGAGPTVVLAQAGDVCGPDGAAEYKRADGYCDRRNNSIYNLHDGDEFECYITGTTGALLRKGMRFDIAQIDCRCDTFASLGIDKLEIGERLLLALPVTECPK